MNSWINNIANKKFFDPNVFQPKLLTTLKNYNRAQFQKDLVAGIIVGIVALPLAIAYGIASGVTPEQGLLTSIIAGFFISALGGSRVQIGGSSAAAIVIISGVVATTGMSGLMAVTILAGVMLVLMGLLKLGDIIKFMPYPVVVGFTTGIALVIFSLQINDLFGLQIYNVPSEFHEKWMSYFHNAHKINYYATAIGIGSILLALYWPKVNKTIPGTLIAIVLTTVVVAIFKLPVETIGSRFGDIDSSIPKPEIPPFDFHSFRTLIPTAFSLALLIAIESLLSAMVADGAIGGKHRSNTELIGQGVANIVAPLFGGIPASGALARTMTNIKNGGRTPIAGIVHTVVLLLILLIFARWTKLIPMSCLAGILVVVAYNMSEWRSFVAIFKNSRDEMAVLVATFLLTVVFDLTVALQVGILLALFLFVRRVSKTVDIQVVKDEIDSGDYSDDPGDNLHLPKGVDVFEIDGPFFFGIANKFEEAYKQVQKPPKVRIIRMRKVPFLDTTGVKNLTAFYKQCKADKTQIILSGVSDSVLEELKKGGLFDLIGAENIFDQIEDAVHRAEELVA